MFDSYESIIISLIITTILATILYNRAAKTASKLTFDEIAKGLGLTNSYVAQLFVGQANLKPATAEKLKKLVPGITAADLELMQEPPMRSFDPALQQDPFVYRLIEAVQHYGRGLKLIANEKFGTIMYIYIKMYIDFVY